MNDLEQSSGAKRWLVVVGIACSLTLVTPPASSGIGKENWEIGFGLGETSFDASAVDNGPRADVRGGYFVTDKFQVEGQLSHATTDVESVGVDMDSFHSTVTAGLSWRIGPDVAAWLSYRRRR